MKSAVNAVQDRPRLVTLVCLLIPVINWICVLLGLLPDHWSQLRGLQLGESLAVYIGVAGAASLVAGFAGVVVVFGLSGNSHSQRVFRASAGRSLRSNWSSVVATGFGAAGLAIAAALMPVLQMEYAAPWVMQAALLLLVHAALRMIWLMNKLIEMVQVDDASVLDRTNVRPLPTIERRSN